MKKSAGQKDDLSPEEKLKQMEKRRVQSVKRDMHNLDTEELEDFVFSAERELAERDPERDDDAELLHISEIFDEIEEESKSRGKVGGISSGYKPLDAMIGGFKNSEVTLIAGESNNGKSMLIANIAANIAREYKTLYITLEMQPRKVGSRMKYAMGNHDEYKQLDIEFQKTFTIDYRSLRPLFTNAVKSGCKIVILDYLQYLGVGMDTREVGIMSRVCVGLAKEFDVPFVIVVSLRKSDSKSSRKWTDITKEDIMGTGAIGYDADNIINISRQDTSCDFDDDGIWIKHLKARDMYIDYKNPYLRLNWGHGRITEDKDYFNETFSDGYKKALEKEKPVQQELTPQETEVQEMLGGEKIDLSEIPF